MPYGTVRPETRQHIESRMREEGIPLEAIKWEPDMFFEDSRSEDPIPEDLYEIAVIYGGALDESFCIITCYEVNLVDWIAEMCMTESLADADHESWSVIAT